MKNLLPAILAYLLLNSNMAWAAPVYKAHNRMAVTQNYIVRKEHVRSMVDQLLVAVTHSANATESWKKLIQPSDVVGIKVAASRGVASEARKTVILAIIESLRAAGHPSDRILVWDRDEAEMQLAGLLPSNPPSTKTLFLPCIAMTIQPTIGYDLKAVYTSPVLGKLIWGDLLFQGQTSIGGVGKQDGLSDESHFAKILCQKVTKIINVPTLSDSEYAGIAGALYNITIPNLDNWRRLVGEPRYGNPFIAEIYSEPVIRKKVVLHILDGLVAQYAGGPTFQPLYSFAHATLYASKDPVALDSIALSLIESWRSQGKLPPIGKQADYIKTAEEIGLGTTKASLIECGKHSE